MQIIDQWPAHFKTHKATAWRVLMRGFTMSEGNRSALDRELFSELIETPIHPFLN